MLKPTTKGMRNGDWCLVDINGYCDTGRLPGAGAMMYLQIKGEVFRLDFCGRFTWDGNAEKPTVEEAIVVHKDGKRVGAGYLKAGKLIDADDA